VAAWHRLASSLSFQHQNSTAALPTSLFSRSPTCYLAFIPLSVLLFLSRLLRQHM
jgi:hypothetical protein